MAIHKVRANPVIPDHEVLRKIGGGAYGEVWLARGVTGAMRAVKVVWREDFEDERTFEREFEGILRYEPISRDHPGLVNILHVGRAPDTKSFYYYVMELGDDVRTGRKINPVEYEPRTLRADTKDTKAQKFPVDECLEVGLRLAEALEHLHEGGLAHRDVKPSNVIFVGGKAKLADIGLVAARGQRTFVGTEGFVPPEGPGSAQADVYSLGKVLYEIATGKDRLDFPELPDELPPPEERKKWIALNRIICDICEPHISKRKIFTAAGLADAIRRVQRGKRRRMSPRTPIVMTCITLFAALSFMAWKRGSFSFASSLFTANPVPDQGQVPPPTQKFGRIRIIVEPDDATISEVNGNIIGTTPSEVMSYPVGTELSFILQMNGYQDKEITHVVTESVAPVLIDGEMKVYSPPIEGSPWSDHLGMRYVPENEMHVSRDLLTENIWRRYVAAEKRPGNIGVVINTAENGRGSRVVLTTAEEATRFCRWHEEGASTSYLTKDQEIMPRMETQFSHPRYSDELKSKNFAPFRIVVRPKPFGNLIITSDPPDVEVHIPAGDGTVINRGRINGATFFDRVPTSNIELNFYLEGYKPLNKTVSLQNKQTLSLAIKMEKNQSVVFGKTWQNSIGMKFIPIGNDLMVGIWETRVADFQAFVQATKRQALPSPSFTQGPEHPVVFTNRNDAMDFCAWLNEKEREQEFIQISHEYRLPTDLEWSRCAGITTEVGNNPGERDPNNPRHWSWGLSWPPPSSAGNFADNSALNEFAVKQNYSIRGYNDNYPYTAPVGSFAANRLGLYDISGNVYEWIADDYDDGGVFGTLRGGGWSTYKQTSIALDRRKPKKIQSRDQIHGFRIVLARPPVTE